MHALAHTCKPRLSHVAARASRRANCCLAALVIADVQASKQADALQVGRHTVKVMEMSHKRARARGDWSCIATIKKQKNKTTTIKQTYTCILPVNFYEF